MGFLNKLLGRKDAALEDAARIYSKLMRQARKPEFYGEHKAPDNYDGRIDILTLHIAVTLKALKEHGQQGERLSQAIFDVMRDDFEVAMREEGLSDTGIKRRIKPMMQLFYTRVKAYVEALSSENAEKELEAAFSTGLLADGENSYSGKFASYAIDFNNKFQNLSLGQIALAEFEIPAPKI